ncbi:helix-turn-helix domain-containing protein [Roseibium litorale]|uniref:Helix-turn-helix domain-containing protein n=1 Tax=Roseibium litorale TaxID=2803841 RepID=A0ABR9CIV4_9HYPH|nr:helix-turn-helix domain-containing protein [Roseibium litorale]MBD8890217.1 helix-turn-helix domain-containing protein [Roseibium litorale]
MKFSTRNFSQHEQFDAWCGFNLGMADLETVGPRSEGFDASAELFQLGRVVMCNYDFPPLVINYNDEAIRRSRLDHWCLGVVTDGRIAVNSDQRGFQVGAGDLAMYSYAMPFAGKLEAASYSSLFFSRDDYWDIADELDRASQLSVRGPMAQIIADFVLTVKKRADTLTVIDGAAVNEALGSLVRAMVRQTPDTLAAAQAPITAVNFDRARRFIAQNLKSPDLSPDMICARLGLSRRNLYYLFEAHGGVATYIKNRRLAACWNVLIKPGERKLISSVAYEYGYTNMSAFSRQFRDRYGCNPSEARSAHIFNQGAASTRTGGTFVDWLSRVEAA